MLRWELVGTFPVPMVHSTYLIHLRNNATDKLQFYPIEEAYTGALDDILIFADSAKRAGCILVFVIYMQCKRQFSVSFFIFYAFNIYLLFFAIYIVLMAFSTTFTSLLRVLNQINQYLNDSNDLINIFDIVYYL